MIYKVAKALASSSGSILVLVDSRPALQLHQPALAFVRCLHVWDAGLTSAMFTSSDGLPVPNPCPEAGLYVRTRDGNEVKVSIPEDCLAFQIGECAQVRARLWLQTISYKQSVLCCTW